VGSGTPQGFVNQEGIVHIAPRRADVNHHLTLLDGGYALQRLAKALVGGYALIGVVELPLFGDSNDPLDLDLAALSPIVNENFVLHLCWIHGFGYFF
jgi:hypothetical protein